MANQVLFNAPVTTGGTQQPLDPSGVEQLPYAQTLIIKALASNTGTIYVQNVLNAAATAGFPLAAGEQIPIQIPTTGLFINGTTTSDRYAVAGS